MLGNYVNSGITSEKTSIICTFISFISGILMIILSCISFHIISVILALVMFACFGFYLVFTIEILRSTVQYKVLINSTSLIVLLKNEKVEINYDDITEINPKKNYYSLNFPLPYMEVKCGLRSPIYLLATGKLIKKLKQIQNSHFMFCLKQYEDYRGPILKRDKVVKF